MNDLEANIRCLKAQLWQEAKGKLRAMYMVEGQCESTDEWRREHWKKLEEAVELFIDGIEHEGLDE